jgi:hypothetical protein
VSRQGRFCTSERIYPSSNPRIISRLSLPCTMQVLIWNGSRFAFEIIFINNRESKTCVSFVYIYLPMSLCLGSCLSVRSPCTDSVPFRLFMCNCSLVYAPLCLIICFCSFASVSLFSLVLFLWACSSASSS